MKLFSKQSHKWKRKTLLMSNSLLLFNSGLKPFYTLFFSGDGRWRQVIRRCASVSDTGVTGVCNWGVYENGDYWEECYCSEDECNSSSYISLSVSTVITVFLIFGLQHIIL